MSEAPPDVEPPVDWDMPPEDAEVLGLQAALLDAQLRALRVEDARATLTIDPIHIRFAGRWPAETRIVVTLEGVRALRAQQWQGDLARFESVAFGDVVAALDGDPLDVADAFLARGPGSVALRVEGLLGERHTDLVLAAESLHVARSDGEPLSLEAWMTLGETFFAALEASRGGAAS